MKKFVRLNSPSSFASGALVTSAPVNSRTFELEISINFGSNSLSPYSGAALLFTNSTFKLGEIFGLASDFKGFAAVIDTHLEKIFLIENYEELTEGQVGNASSCEFKSTNRQKVIQLKVLENYFEVLVKDKSFKKCAGIQIRNLKFPFFAVASNMGNNTNVLFDVLQIQAREVEDEETTNKLLRDLDKELGEEVQKLKIKWIC